MIDPIVRPLAQVVGLVAIGAVAVGCDEQPAAEEPLRDWVFLFHIPNDNDLDRHTERILAEIQRGLRSDRVAATALVDRADGRGLRRVAMTSGERREELLAGVEDSADVEVFSDYLSWTSETFPARRYAVALLGHGGQLDQIALDLRPGAGAGPRWASSTAVAEALRRWRGGQLEVLFLHQCGRATLEELYSFREVAGVVVASETFVGAPNTYYQPLLELASVQREISADQVADLIVEADEHAATLSVFDGRALSRLPEVADELVEAFERAEGERLARPQQRLPAYLHAGEVTYDVCGFLGELARRNGLAGDEQVSRNLDWLRLRLVRRRSTRRVGFPWTSGAWCGVAMVVTPDPAARDHPIEVAFYRDSRWLELHRRLAPPRVVPGDPEVISVEGGQPPPPP